MKTVYKILPVFVNYGDFGVPDKFGACTRAIFVFIRKKYQDDTGLLMHEKTHVKQFYRTLGLHPFLYLLSKTYRLKSEVEAYREQLKWKPYNAGNKELFAGFLRSKYNLIISRSDSIRLLS